jgi:3-hydroxyacyl-CoA dehydrogenase
VFRWAFIGPLATADFGGLDIWKSVVENLAPVLSKEIKIPAFVEETLLFLIRSMFIIAPLWIVPFMLL